MYSKDFMKSVMVFVAELESSIKEFKEEVNIFKERLEDSWEEIKSLKNTIAEKDAIIEGLKAENKALKISAISDKAVLKEVLPKLKDLEVKASKAEATKLLEEEVKEDTILREPYQYLEKKKKEKKVKAKEHKAPKQKIKQKNQKDKRRSMINIYT
jgi:septal ring factor EnvC (AmiA/AmiB activator)